MVVNEFASGKYDDLIATGDGETVGEATLIQFGFTRNGVPFTSEWVWYGVLAAIGTATLALFVTVYFLNNIRFATGTSLATEHPDPEVFNPSEDRVEIPFTKVNLTFSDIRYTVNSSNSDEKIELLKGIDGIVESGKMTALMGSSGKQGEVEGKGECHFC